MFMKDDKLRTRLHVFYALQVVDDDEQNLVIHQHLLSDQCLLRPRIQPAAPRKPAIRKEGSVFVLRCGR